MKKPKLTDSQKLLLDKIDDKLVKQLLTFVCLGQSEELTPLACENLIKAYIERGV